MGHSPVRQSRFHYHYGCTFTSPLTSFTSKYVVFSEQLHPIEYDPVQYHL